jgi:pimeloyl-ACP methyl ester carboxylesterase
MSASARYCCAGPITTTISGSEGTGILGAARSTSEPAAAGIPALTSQRPPLRQTLSEAIALVRRVTKPASDTLAQEEPAGDGHAVLVLPALLRGDGYTTSVRQFLTAIGYAAFGWELGVNIGPVKRLLDGASDRLIALSDRHGPISLVGFSMGGLFARWLSLHLPERVRQVITVCSPIYEPAKNFWLPVDSLIRLWPDVDLEGLAQEIARPLDVPGTFLFSPDNGIVNCAACRDAAAGEDNIEISGPHVLIAQSPEVMAIVACRLARQFAASANRPAD